MNLRVLVTFLLLTFGAAYLGGQSMPGPWYAGLAKPPFNPPSWVFAPVWTLLYAMIAVAGWKAWVAGRGNVRILPFFFWTFQLALGGVWSWLFFGLHRIDLAAVDISVLWLAIGATIFFFWRLNKLASLLLVPYLLWVSFATVLTFSLWRLNP